MVSSAATVARDPALEGVAPQDQPFVNSLKMKFVQVPISAGPSRGKRVLFSIWETRVGDFGAFIRGNSEYRYSEGTAPFAWHNQTWEQQPGVSWEHPGFSQTDNHPVTCVSWWDAVAFCKWLTKTERATRRIGLNDEYRLPTDVEWSFVVGIGEREDSAKTPQDKDGKIPDVFPWGAEWPPPIGFGNYGFGMSGSTASDRFDQTAPVGSFATNALGLYDLGGNVAEWCDDPYNQLQPWRVVRGGSWIRYDREGLASSFRNCAGPGYRRTNRGFRCVLAVDK